MKRNVSCVLFLLLLWAGFAVAQTAQTNYFPASNIILTYDSKSSTLHVQATHPSQNWEVDYIRMMTVSLNGAVVSTLNYNHQTGPGFSDTVPLSVKPGDVITVDLSCSGGSSNSQDLTVTDADVSQTPSTDTNSNVPVNGDGNGDAGN